MSSNEKPILAIIDYPYFDFHQFDDTEEPAIYWVGTDNKDRDGTQKKLFVSKSTLIYSDVACTIRFNGPNNVLTPIPANTWFTFVSDIYALVVVTIADGGYLLAYFEGVLPQDSRCPE